MREAGADLHRRLFEAGPDAIVVADQIGRIVFLNLRTEALFGYARDELLGKPIEVLIPERFAFSHAAHRTNYVAAPRVRPMKSGLELSARRRDGSEFPVEVSLSPVATAEGLLVSAGIRDLSERVESERNVRVTQEHLLSAIESIQGAFAIFDECDRLVLCNSDFRCLFGLLHLRGVEGRSFAELLDDALTAGTFSRGGRPHDELRAMLLHYHRAPSGSLDFVTAAERHLRMVERRTTDGGAVVTIWDVTEVAQRAEQLRRARADAESANAAKSEFLASMSHELRTPLNAILGFAQLLQRDRKSPLSERHRERVDQILGGGEHLLRLIDDVLDLSRIEAGHVSMSLEPVDVSELLIDVKATLDPMAARAGVQIAVAPVPPLPYALADRTRFRQILMNYGTNAIKYNRPGGTATFRASARDGRMRVSVIDDGVGIPEDRQGCIFEPFQRAGQETGPIQGTGIGLTITRRLADLMGGTVGFHSAEGKGSEFWLDVPAHEVDAPGPSQRGGRHRGGPRAPA